MTGVILASTSKYRKALVERLGLRVLAVPPGVDEESFKARFENPRGLAAALAAAKARAVAAMYPGTIVIGGDQLVSFQGQVLGKPGTIDQAIAQLEALSGHTHELVTAMTVIGQDGSERSHVDISRLTMRKLDRSRIARYAHFDEPVDCAGAYMLESGGIALFETIETEDHSAITGLPLMVLTRFLEELGVAVP